MSEDNSKKNTTDSEDKSKPQMSPNRRVKEGSQPSVIETIYGKYSKYQIVRKSKIFGATFCVKKNGEVISGMFSSLEAAVNWVEKKV